MFICIHRWACKANPLLYAFPCGNGTAAGSVAWMVNGAVSTIRKGVATGSPSSSLPFRDGADQVILPLNRIGGVKLMVGPIGARFSIVESMLSTLLNPCGSVAERYRLMCTILGCIIGQISRGSVPEDFHLAPLMEQWVYHRDRQGGNWQRYHCRCFLTIYLSC